MNNKLPVRHVSILINYNEPVDRAIANIIDARHLAGESGSDRSRHLTKVIEAARQLIDRAQAELDAQIQCDRHD